MQMVFHVRQHGQRRGPVPTGRRRVSTGCINITLRQRHKWQVDSDIISSHRYSSPWIWALLPDLRNYIRNLWEKRRTKCWMHSDSSSSCNLPQHWEYAELCHGKNPIEISSHLRMPEYNLHVLPIDGQNYSLSETTSLVQIPRDVDCQLRRWRLMREGLNLSRLSDRLNLKRWHSRARQSAMSIRRGPPANLTPFLLSPPLCSLC